MTRREILVTALLVVLLAAATWIAYRPALHSGFLNWDDPDTVTGNEHVTGGLPGLGHILTGRVFATWLPVYFGSLWADHAVFGPDPYLFHLGNLLLHLLNALLVLWIARRIGLSAEVSFGAAFLFALHPAAVQSVAWISERKGLLAFLFSGFSILVFLRAVQGRGRRRALLHGAGALLLALALLSKGSALAVPLILLALVLALRPGERPGARDLLPYFAVAGALAAVHYAIALDEGTALASDGPGTGELLVANLAVLGRYLRLLVLPFWGQSAIHDVPVGGFSPGAALGAAAIVVLAVLLVVAWRRERPLFFALAAAVLALAPFNNLFPRTTVLFAERYLYLSLLGASIAIALVVERALAARPAVLRRGALVAVVLLFGGFLAVRARVWREPVTLFRDAVAKSDGAWLAEMKLGEALSERAQRPGSDAGDWSGAADAFRRAVGAAGTALDEVRARANLSGVLLAVGGREEEVLDVARAAEARLRELDEEEREALSFHLSVNRGTALAALDRPEEAVEAYRAAARARPLDPAPLTALVGALLAAERPGEALEAGREATRLAPGDETAALVLAQALLATGDVGESRRVLESLIERNPAAAGALAFLGRIELASSRPRAARERFAAAIEARPDLDSARRGIAEAEVLVARSHLVVGKREEARAAAERAMAADPSSAEAVWIAGWATEEPEEADALLLRASRMEGGERARDLLARHRLAHAVARLDAGDDGSAENLAAGAVRAGAAFLAGTGDLRIRGDLPRLAALAADRPAAGRHAALLGTALVFAEGREDEGEARLGEAVARAGDAGEFEGDVVRAALYVRGRSRLSRGDARGAREDFSVLLDLRPEDVAAAEGLAEALYHVAVTRQTEGKEAGETFEAARAAAGRALELDPASLPAKLTAGRVAFATGNSMESLKLFLAAKREHPGRVEPMLALAGQYRATFQMTGEKTYLARAREELEAAVAADPHDARARAELGQVLLRAGEAAQASRQLQLAIAEDPGLTSAREDLAELYVRAGRAQLEQGGPDGRERAADLAQRALALEVERAGPYLLVAELHRLERDYAPAQEALEKAAETAPESPEVKDALASFYKDLGYALLLRRERDRAVAAFERALAAGSETVDLDPVRQFLSGADGEPAPEPDPEVARILAEKSEKARAFFEEAGEKLAAGDAGGAEEAILRSIATFSTAEGWYRLGRIKEARRDREAAIRAYANAVREKPSLAPAWLALGTARYFRGEWQEALEAYEGFLAVAGDDTREETRVMIRERVEELRRTIDEENR